MARRKPCKYRHLTDEDRASVIALRRANPTWTLARVSVVAGVSRATVNRVLDAERKRRQTVVLVMSGRDRRLEDVRGDLPAEEIEAIIEAELARIRRRRLLNQAE